MKGYWESGVYSSTNPLTSALDGVNGQLQALAALSQRNSPCYPLNKRLGGPQSSSGSGGEEKNSQPPPGIET
jgi:hypothetical protein